MCLQCSKICLVMVWSFNWQLQSMKGQWNVTRLRSDQNNASNFRIEGLRVRVHLKQYVLLSTKYMQCALNHLISLSVQKLFSTCTRVPEIEGTLHCKDFGKKSWSKKFIFLRGSGLYSSSKGKSKVQSVTVMI